MMGYSPGFKGKRTLLITNSLLVFSPVPKRDAFCPTLSNLLFSPSLTSSLCFLSHQSYLHFLGFSWHVSCPASPRSQYPAYHLITVFHLTLVFSNASPLQCSSCSMLCLAPYSVQFPPLPVSILILQGFFWVGLPRLVSSPSIYS